MGEYIDIGKINKKMIGEYGNIIITEKVILTKERLYNHILVKHKKEYEQIEGYIKSIVEDPDIILEDSTHIDTLIFLKNILEINRKARIVIKLATNKCNKIYTMNSIITIMRQRDKSWEQTIKNKGKIIFDKS